MLRLLPVLVSSAFTSFVSQSAELDGTVAYVHTVDHAACPTTFHMIENTRVSSHKRVNLLILSISYFKKQEG
jgi:hypothetical protein